MFGSNLIPSTNNSVLPRGVLRLRAQSSVESSLNVPCEPINILAQHVELTRINARLQDVSIRDHIKIAENMNSTVLQQNSENIRIFNRLQNPLPNAVEVEMNFTSTEGSTTPALINPFEHMIKKLTIEKEKAAALKNYCEEPCDNKLFEELLDTSQIKRDIGQSSTNVFIKQLFNEIGEVTDKDYPLIKRLATIINVVNWDEDWFDYVSDLSKLVTKLSDHTVFSELKTGLEAFHGLNSEDFLKISGFGTALFQQKMFVLFLVGALTKKYFSKFQDNPEHYKFLIELVASDNFYHCLRLYGLEFLVELINNCHSINSLIVLTKKFYHFTLPDLPNPLTEVQASESDQQVLDDKIVENNELTNTSLNSSSVDTVLNFLGLGSFIPFKPLIIIGLKVSVFGLTLGVAIAGVRFIVDIAKYKSPLLLTNIEVGSNSLSLDNKGGTSSSVVRHELKGQLSFIKFLRDYLQQIINKTK